MFRENSLDQYSSRRFVVDFNMLAPGMTESSITNAIVSCYGGFFGPENSLDYFTTSPQDIPRRKLPGLLHGYEKSLDYFSR